MYACFVGLVVQLLVDMSCWSVLLYSHLTSVAQAISVLVDNIDKGNESELDPYVF